MTSPLDAIVARRSAGGSPARVVVAVAHPDDEALLCGGTIAALAASGCVVHVVCFSAEPADRAEIFAKSCEVLGATGELLDLVTGQMVLDKALVSATDDLLRRTVPDCLVTHSRSGGQHQDHVALHDAVRLSVTRWPHPPLVLAVEPPSSSAGFVPNVFVDIGVGFPDKLDAVGHYRKAVDRRYMDDDYLLTRARWWGQVSGRAGALCEAYELVVWR